MHNVQSISHTKIVDVTELVGKVDNESLKGEVENHRHLHMYSEKENGKHRAFNYAMDILDAQTLSQKLDKVFQKLK